jgi:hypothetical protein
MKSKSLFDARGEGLVPSRPIATRRPSRRRTAFSGYRGQRDDGFRSGADGDLQYRAKESAHAFRRIENAFLSLKNI